MAGQTLTATGRSKHLTTTGGTGNHDTVTLDRGYYLVEVVNDDASTGLYFTVAAGSNDTETAPTVGGDGAWYVGPGAVRIVKDDVAGAATGGAPNATKVQVISATAVACHVTGLDGA